MSLTGGNKINAAIPEQCVLEVINLLAITDFTVYHRFFFLPRLPQNIAYSSEFRGLVNERIIGCLYPCGIGFVFRMHICEKYNIS